MNRNRWAVLAAAVAIAGAGPWPLAGAPPATAGDDDPAAPPGKTEPKPADKPADKPAEATKAPENAAPEFTLKDTNGKEHSLKDYKGKIVVLEWTNHKCPWVIAQYSKDLMQAVQRKYTEKGVIWLSVCSSGPGLKGNMTNEAWNEKTKALKAAPTAVLIDADGKVGHLYGAKVTPHMFVIGKDGAIAYKGAIDSGGKRKDTGAVQNYVADALDALLEGKVPEIRETQPMG